MKIWKPENYKDINTITDNTAPSATNTFNKTNNNHALTTITNNNDADEKGYGNGYDILFVTVIDFMLLMRIYIIDKYGEAIANKQNASGTFSLNEEGFSLISRHHSSEM